MTENDELFPKSLEKLLEIKKSINNFELLKSENPEISFFEKVKQSKNFKRIFQQILNEKYIKYLEVKKLENVGKKFEV